jgi:hypothetical protein
VIEKTAASRGGRWGSLVSPPMKTRRPSRHGAATSPVRRSIGATCRGRPRRRLPAAPKYHRRDSRWRSRAIRLWARARDKQLALPERTSGRSTTVWRPAGRAPPSHRDPHPAKPTPEKVGGAAGVHPPALQWLGPP